MAVQTVPYALQNASHSAAVFRQATSAAFVSGGILASGELSVTQQGTPNMSVILGPGRAKVVGNSVSPPSGLAFTTQAMYDTLNDANLTLTVAASNPTNPRIDAVYIQVQDSYYSGASNQAIAGIVTGTPAVSPIAPAVPTNSILIAYIAVAANATSVISANLSYQASVASVINTPPTFASIAARSAFFPTPATGQQCYMTSAPLVLMEYNGAGWQKRGLVKPSAAVATGGSATINDDGSVSLAAVTGIIFTNGMMPQALYDTDTYEIEITGMFSVQGTIAMQMAAAGSADGTTNYDYFGAANVQSGTSSGPTSIAQSSWPITDGGACFIYEARIEVRHAQNGSLAKHLDMIAEIIATPGSGMKRISVSMDHRATTVFDGIRLVFSQAFTGTVKFRPKA